MSRNMERLHDSGYDDESSSSHDLLADDGSTPSGDVIISSCKELKISTPCERLSVDDDVREMLLQRCAASPSSSLTSSFSSLSSLPSVHRHDVGSWRLMTKGGLQIKGANLLWHWNDHKHIWDVEFMEDGNLVIIAGQNVKIEGKVVSIKRKRFHCLGLDGRILEVPFPGKYHDPGGISMCKETGALAITDTMRGANAADVTILRNCDNKWMFKSHKTEQAAFRVALTESDTAICAVRWEKLVKYKDTTPVWSRSISTSNDLVPYINMDRCGRIIVSTPRSQSDLSIQPRRSAIGCISFMVYPDASRCLCG